VFADALVPSKPGQSCRHPFILSTSMAVIRSAAIDRLGALAPWVTPWSLREPAHRHEAPPEPGSTGCDHAADVLRWLSPDQAGG